MVKLLVLIGLALVASKLLLGRWPWEYLRASSTRSRAVLRARQLLGVKAGASHAQIIAAHKRLLTMVHPDRGGTSEAVHEANAARDLLLDELPGAPPLHEE